MRHPGDRPAERAPAPAPESTASVEEVTALLERLGRSATDKLVILVCDGLGSSNAANLGVALALRDGVATTAGLQVPCPWARGAAGQHQGEDVGVSLTFNAQFDLYRWGPITRAPSLLDLSLIHI